MLEAFLLSSLLLIPTGEIDALKGRIVHASGLLYGVVEDQAHTHRNPGNWVSLPENGTTIAAPALMVASFSPSQLATRQRKTMPEPRPAGF